MKKFLITLVLIIMLIIVALFNLYWFYINDDKDFCLDSGRCVEGLEINTEHGKIKINKENCLKYGWKWNEDRKWCNLNN